MNEEAVKHKTILVRWSGASRRNLGIGLAVVLLIVLVSQTLPHSVGFEFTAARQSLASVLLAREGAHTLQLPTPYGPEATLERWSLFQMTPRGDGLTPAPMGSLRTSLLFPSFLRLFVSWPALSLALLVIPSLFLLRFGVRRLSQQLEANASLSVGLMVVSPAIVYALSPTPFLLATALLVVGLSVWLDARAAPRQGRLAGALFALACAISPSQYAALISALLLDISRPAGRHRAGHLLTGSLAVLLPIWLWQGMTWGTPWAVEATAVPRWLMALSGFLQDVQSSDLTTWLWHRFQRLGGAHVRPELAVMLILPGALLLVRGGWTVRDGALGMAAPRGVTVNALWLWGLAAGMGLLSLTLEADPIAALSSVQGLLPLCPWLALTLYGRPLDREAPPAEAISQVLLLIGLTLLLQLLFGSAPTGPSWSQPQLLPLIGWSAPLAARGIHGLWLGRPPPRVDRSTQQLLQDQGGLSQESLVERMRTFMMQPLLVVLVGASLLIQSYGLILMARGRGAIAQMQRAEEGLAPDTPLGTSLNWYGWFLTMTAPDRPRSLIQSREDAELFVAWCWLNGHTRLAWASSLSPRLFLSGLPLTVLEDRVMDIPQHPSRSFEILRLSLPEDASLGQREELAKLAARAGRTLITLGETEAALRMLNRGLPLTQSLPLRRSLKGMIRSLEADGTNPSVEPIIQGPMPPG